ncbi:MAG: sulfurtransferase TusA family protein [Candidatus Binataceae bacterium]|jgi:tRNA 2-thiouridine synthesizing protein A
MSEADPNRIDAEWDAGDMGCGELIVELRKRVRAIQPGQVLRLIARDPGAIEDLPAWCRMTGHRMNRAEHPVYFIQRKED